MYPFKMIGRYEDDDEEIVGGDDENDCMYKLIELQDVYGNLVWYSTYYDEDYVDGYYIGDIDEE